MTAAKTRRPTAMTIAGSDSGGGAGIQADLKTFAALGVFGTTAITAITAQNTLGVDAVQEVDLDVISSQIDAVISDIGVDAAKTGMLSSAGIIETVAERVSHHGMELIVVDPVMVATSGARLLREDAITALVTRLLPLGLVVTPNLAEAEALVDRPLSTDDQIRDAAREIHDMGPGHVIIKGGHLSGDAAVDVLFDGQAFHEYSADRIETRNTHGTGCTFSSAIAAGLARGMSVPDAVGLAKAFVTEAIRRAYPVGQGSGPLHHLYALDDLDDGR